MCQEKYFREALKRGQSENGTYLLENPKRASLTAYDLRQYAKQNGFLVGRVTRVDSKSGSPAVVVGTLEFMKPENYDAFVYSCLSGSPASTMPQAKGICYLLPRTERVKKRNGLSISVVKRNTHGHTLTRIEDIMWTGSIVDGNIHGRGIGFFVQDDKYFCFEGNFAHGFPIEDMTLKGIRLNKDKMDILEEENIKYLDTPKVDSDVLGEFATNSDERLKAAAKFRLMENYDDAVKKLEESYNKAKTINKTNYSKFKKDYYPERFCDMFKTVASQNVLEKAEELRDFNNVIAGLNAPILVKCYDETSVLSQLFGALKTKWDQKTVDYVESKIDKGIASCAKLKTSSKFGFKNFCMQTEQALKKKKTDFTAAVNNSRAEYDNIHNQEYSAKQREWQAEEKRQKELSTEIDWERSKSPSGGLYYPLIGVYDYCMNEGEVRFKSGIEYVKYNAFYHHDIFDHYGITGASSKISSKLKKSEFKTEGEMYEAIINAIK